MNVAVIFTGGTISCAPPDIKGVLAVHQTYYILEYYKNNSSSIYKNDVVFDTFEPLQVLSENMTISNWNLLIKTLKNVDYKKYDGIIITHGSDTLPYTSSLFSMLMAGINIPVVFVASNHNLFDPDSNGHSNFENAVDFICQYKFPGTFVIFRNNHGHTSVYLGSRVKQSQAFIDSYESVNGIDLGYIDNNVFTPILHECNPKSFEISRSPLLNEITSLDSCVLLIKPYTGLRYDLFNLNCNIKAVLHETYHSFTACTGDPYSVYSIINFKNRCRNMNIPLFLAPFKNKTEKYFSTDIMLQNDIYGICGMSVESAYTKLLIACSLYTDIEDIKDFLDKNIFYESFL